MRAGIFQCAGGGHSPGERLDRLSAAVSSAIEDRPLDLVVCPELFLSGYNVGAELSLLAEPADGPFAGKISELAQASGSAIAYGYPEKTANGLYNSVALFGPAGNLIANHRKCVLPPGFEARFFETGDAATLFDLCGMHCAILICYEAEFPEALRAAAEAGAQLVIVPTALIEDWASVALQMMPTRAFENGVWLLYANHAGRENGSHYLGSSCIIAPDGQDEARAGAQEALICAEIDLGRVSAAQGRLPYLHDLARIRAIADRR